MDPNQVASFFNNYLNVASNTTGIPYESLVFFIICLFLNVWILSKGLSSGIEKASKIGMPLLIVFGIFLVIKALSLKSRTTRCYKRWHCWSEFFMDTTFRLSC